MKRTPPSSQPVFGSTSSSPRQFRCVSENLATFPSSPPLLYCALPRWVRGQQPFTCHPPLRPPNPVRPELKLGILPLPQTPGPARVLETWPGSRQGWSFQGREGALLSAAGRSVGLPDALSLQTPRPSLPGCVSPGPGFSSDSGSVPCELSPWSFGLSVGTHWRTSYCAVTSINGKPCSWCQGGLGKP